MKNKTEIIKKEIQNLIYNNFFLKNKLIKKYKLWSKFENWLVCIEIILENNVINNV